MPENSEKIIVIVGTTASGKTRLAVRLAYKFNGEIVSADSRQVYKGMDVGTGKDLKDYRLKIPNSKFQIPNKFQNPKSKIKKYKIVKIPYHLIDVVSPKTEFSLAKYQKLAYKAMDDILSRGKLPIIAGGTGLYVQAIVDGYKLSGAKPDKKLRAKLEKMPVKRLFLMLKKLDAKKAKSLNESDRSNKRRLIRYIEIHKSGPTAFKAVGPLKPLKPYNALIIGLTLPKEVLRKRIYERLVERLEKEDMIGEVERLRRRGVSWKRLEGFGLEYKYVSLYLRNKLAYDEMVEKLNIAIRQFAKRQMTWFKRDKRINWVKSEKEAEKLVNEFLR